MTKETKTYIFITFLVTWSVSFVSYYLYTKGDISFSALNYIYNIAAIGPLSGALVSAYLFYGKEGIKKLFSRFTFTGISKYSLILSLSPLLCAIPGFLLYPLYSGHWYTFEVTKSQFQLSGKESYIHWILPFITYSFLEEFGWRGYLLPHLQDKFNALKATFLLTIFWAAWHLPFFLWRMKFSPFISVGFFFAIFIGAIILTSVYNSSRGSIIPVILFHLCNNIASALEKQFVVAVVSTGFVFLAIFILKKWKTESLSFNPRIRNFYRQ